VSDVLVIGGNTINLAAYLATLDLLVPFMKGGIPQLHFSRIIQKLATPITGPAPDPWDGKSCSLTMGGTLVFTGDINGYIDRFMGSQGWTREYRALGLIDRAKAVPVTDSSTLTDTSIWNLPGDDYQNFVGARAGQTVGQIVANILCMAVNAAALSALGIGNYVYTGTYALPSITQADLNALTIIPPFRVSISGERILDSLARFVESCHPNHFLHVDPNGNIRFLDPRTFANQTLTLGSDPRLGMPQLTRDHADCWSQVEVRGNTLVQGITLQTSPWPGSSLSDGGLQEDFAWGSYNNAQAKTNWVPACWNQPMQSGNYTDTGTCTMSDTQHVTVTSSLSTVAYPVNYWNQSSSGVLGNIVLFGDLYAGSATQIAQARVVASTAQGSPGGTFTVTLDRAMPGTQYNAYQLWGLTSGCNAVGRKYKVTNSALGQAMMQYFPWPFPLIGANGNSAAMTTTPVCQVLYSASGNPPWNVATVGLTLDPVNGIIYLDRPSQTIYGNPQWPSNVQVFLPIAGGTLTAFAPSATTYQGTLYTQLGLTLTKIITCLDWRDYSNQANMAVFASEALTSFQDVVVEGTLPYYGLLSAYLAPGNSVSIAGSGYTTGWESLADPVVSVEIGFLNGPSGTSYSTVLHLSNRRGRYSSEAFLRPNITHGQYGTGQSIGATGLMQGSVAAVDGGTTYDQGANRASEDAQREAATRRAPIREPVERLPQAERLPFERLPQAESPRGPRPDAFAAGMESEEKKSANIARQSRQPDEEAREADVRRRTKKPADERAISLGLLGTKQQALEKADKPDWETAEQDPHRADTDRAAEGG